MPKHRYKCLKILVSAGEPSGELYAVELIKHLGPYVDGKFFSLFAGQFENLGVEGVIPGNPLLRSSSGVVGLSEALRIAPWFFANLFKVKKFVEREKPEVVILIDYPEVNLRLARWAKSNGSLVIYLAPPQVWAWREWRVKTIRSYVDEAIVFLPFEKDYYRRKGVRAHFLGHPLIDLLWGLLNADKRDNTLGVPRIAVLPGSRPSEWRHHLDILIGVMRRLLEELGNIEFVLPLPRENDLLLEEFLEGAMRHHREVFEKVFVARSERYRAIKSCELGIVASGTATLELALLGIPMVVFYRVSPLSALAAKLLIKTPFVSLPNLIVGGYLVPELLQNGATPEAIFRFAMLLIYSDELRMWQRKGFEAIRKSFGQKGVWQRISQHIRDRIEKGRE